MSSFATIRTLTASPRGSGHSGFTIIEALIALAVVSLALIGAASLQTSGLFANASSLLRVKASYKAYEMADRMRANLMVFTPANTGYLTNATTTLCAAGAPGSLVTDCSAGTSGCTPQEIAQNDLCEWKTDLALQLPSGDGTVCVDSTPNDGTPAAPACDGIAPLTNGMPALYTVKIWWNDDRSGILKRFVTVVRP